MRKNLKPKALIYPLPVLIIGTYDGNGVANAMNAAWGTVCDVNQIMIVISHDHKTTKNIFLKKEFTVSIADKDNVIPADYVGMVSGDKVVDKISKTGWHIERSNLVDAPIFTDLPLCMECKMVSYDEETEVLIAEIVGISADEKIVHDGEKINLNVFKPICYDTSNHNYLTLGEVVGKAFNDGTKLK